MILSKPKLWESRSQREHDYDGSAPDSGTNALWRVPLSLFEVKSRIRAPSALILDFLPRTARPGPLRDARRRSTIKLLYGPGIAFPGLARLRDIVDMILVSTI